MKTQLVSCIFFLCFSMNLNAQAIFSSSELSPQRRIDTNIKIKIFQPPNTIIKRRGSFKLKFYLINNSNEDIYISSPYCFGIDPSPFQFMVNDWNSRWRMTPGCYGSYKEKCILKIEAGSARKFEINVSELRTSFMNEIGKYKLQLSYNYLFQSKDKKKRYHMIRNRNLNLGLKLSSINTAWSNEIEIDVK